MLEAFGVVVRPHPDIIGGWQVKRTTNVAASYLFHHEASAWAFAWGLAFPPKEGP